VPRIRTLKPEIWQSRDFVGLDNLGKLTFIALITQADDEGRLRTDAHHLALTCLQGNRTPAVQQALYSLVQRRMVVMYEVEGESFIALTSWDAHQRVSHATPSRIPAPPISPERSGALANIPENSGALAKPREHSGTSARARADRSIGSDLSTPPTPPPAAGDKATVILHGFLEASNKSSYSPMDATKAQEYAGDFQRLSGEQIADLLREHAEWMASQKKRPYGKLEYYAEFLRQKHDLAADNGARIVGSSPTGRGGELSHISGREVDPDDE